jgi:hypothetical protein
LPFVFTLGWPNSSTRLSYGIGSVVRFACDLCESWSWTLKNAATKMGYLLEFTAFITKLPAPKSVTSPQKQKCHYTLSTSKSMCNSHSCPITLRQKIDLIVLHGQRWTAANFVFGHQICDPKCFVLSLLCQALIFGQLNLSANAK